MVKINDRYEFPLQLDLDREDGKYLSPDADRRVHNLYTLYSVLVHSGGECFIRPTLSEQWFKFDDERVTKEDIKRALEEQYGGEVEFPQTNPGDRDKVMCDVDEKDIAEYLRVRLMKEQEVKEHKKKEKAEAHLYTIIKVARNEDLFEQIGRNIYIDLVDLFTKDQFPFGDLINDLKTKVELSHPDAELRLLDVYSHKIWKKFPVNEKIEDIGHFVKLRAEEIPEEEKNLGPQAML
ncbi:hypothetical protein MKW92_038946 [Papaver armeniacum]|nr:hypothetical protein MKW92_038946 [Papaver armeniacum]